MIDNLTEAITHARKVAMEKREEEQALRDRKDFIESNERNPKGIYDVPINQCKECAADHEQLVAWLTELQDRREADRWIPVSEKLPDDLEPVNITWINHEPEPYYKEIKDKPFTATGVYFNGQWYWWSTLCTDILAEYSHNYDDIVDTAIEITHWRPLPKFYESEDK